MTEQHKSNIEMAAANRPRLRGLLYAALLSPAILAVVSGGPAQAGQLSANAFTAYNPANAATITAGPLALFSVNVDSISPTQLNEGLTEVGKKTAGFDLLAPSQLQANLLTDIEPVVIGPGGKLYLTDGHHTFTALEDSIYGASNPTVFVDVVANFSNLTPSQFFAAMQSNNLLLPINDGVPQTVNTATGAPIPSVLTGLTSDPYRGLEYSILKNKSAKLFTTANNLTGAVGASTPGLDKMNGFYEDFFEADAYRDANGGRGLAYLSPGDIALATQWNLNGASTTTLPNVTGTVTAAQLPGFILNQNIVNAGGISNSTLAGGALDGNGTFTGITTLNAGTTASPVTIGSPNTGLVLQVGADKGHTVTLNGTNTYTGGTTLLAGTLIVQSDAALGAAATGAAIDLTNVKTSVQAANGIVFNSLDEGAATLTLGTTTGGTFTTNRAIAVGGETATLNVNGNTVTLGGQIYSLGVGGDGIGNATGFSDVTIDDLSGGSGKLILSQASPNFNGNIIVGSTGTPIVEVMNDAALGATTGSPTAIGQVELNGGTLQAGASFAAPERNLFLGGGSNFDVNGFTTSWGTLTNVQRTLDVLNSNTTTLGAVTFNAMVIGATSTLQLAGGAAGETVTFTNGITRTGNDTLVLNPTSSTSLGTTEKVFSGTAAASLVNGIAPAWMVTNNGVSTKSAGPYDFVTYGANGYVKATYTNTATLNGATAGQVVALSGNATLTGAASVYALNTEGKTIGLGSNTLTLGDGVNPAGLILASGSALNGGTLAFGGSEGVIWLSGANPTISSAITGSNGLTFAGSGAVAISTAANVSGPITIDSGTVTLSGANIFAGNTGGILLDDTKSKPAAATLAITANNSLTTLNSVGANSAVNISNGAALTLGDTTSNLSSTLSATVKETGATTAGALTLHGSGLFDFSGGSVGLVAGSTLVVDDSAQLRLAVGAVSGSTWGIVLNGANTQLQFAQNGGGQFSNTVSGTGSLHLIGGTLLLTGTNNSYSGGTLIEAGSTLDLTTANVSSGNANIANAGGLVVFDQATNGTYAGVISDGKQMGTGPVLSGSFDKDDSTGANGGNVTFTQAQTYTGATTVEAGTLTLAATDTLATSSGVDLGRIGGGSTATLALTANNTLKALTSETGDTTAVTMGGNNLTLNNQAGATSIFGGSITGTGALVKNGAGTEVFTGAVTPGSTTVNAGMLAVMNGGTIGGASTTVTGGALLVGAGSALNTASDTVNGGLLEVASGGALTAASTTVNGGMLQIDNGASFAGGMLTVNGGTVSTPMALNAAAFNNNGMLDLRNGSANNVVTVGAYNGAAGSKVLVGVNFSTQASDKLVVSSVTGSSQVVVSDLSPSTPGFYNPTGITVVSSLNPMNPASFTLAGGPIQKGLFQEDLAYNPDPGFVLVGVPTGDAFRLSTLPTAAQAVTDDTAAVLLDHQTELRGLLGDAASPDAVTGSWARAVGDWANREQTQTYSVFNKTYTYQTGYSQQTDGLFVGTDGAKQGASGDMLVAGIAAGYIDSTQSFKGSSTEARYEGGSVAVTASYMNQGFYVDGALKADIMSVKLSVPSLAGFGQAQANSNIVNYGAFLDTGYRITVGGAGYIEPLAGLAYLNSRIDDLSLAGAGVTFGDNDTLRGRLGVSGGMTLSNTGDQVIKLSATASYWARLSGGAGAVINSSPNAPLLSLSDNQVTNYGDVGLSLTTRSTMTGWSGFLNAGYQFASDYNSATVQAGLHYKF